VFNETELLKGYNTNLKVNPPLRSEQDRLALIDGVKNGVIDCITTHHTPQNKDAKICEFEYAGYGALGLEAAFGILNNNVLNQDQILDAICYNPRRIFGLSSVIEKGSKADITLFETTSKSTFQKDDLRSKCENCPYLGLPTQGSVKAVILNNITNINQ
jgi:dihydroorotase